MALIHQLDQLALAHDRVGHVEPCKFILMRRIDPELFDEPVVQRPVRDELKRANAVRNCFYGVALSMSKIVHRIDTPRVSRPVVVRVFDSIHDRVAEVHVGMCHIDLRPQYFFAITIAAGFHFPEQTQVVLNTSPAIGTIRSRLGRRTLLMRNFVTRTVIDVRKSLANQRDGEFIEFVEIIGCVQFLRPGKSQPFDVVLDSFNILRFFRYGVRIVESEISLATVLNGQSEVEANTFGMAQVKIAVWLGGKPRDDLAVPALFQVILNDFLQEVITLHFSHILAFTRTLKVARIQDTGLQAAHLWHNSTACLCVLPPVSLPLRAMSEVRVRFAPSPTGPLHIGGVRTALYNYLLARQSKGTMILRIEDTDQNRYVPGAEDYIIRSLAWAGIQIDEGVGVGGPHAPYRQSERRDLYSKYAAQLVNAGHAYYAFDTEDELEKMRERLKTSGSDHHQYSPSTRMSMRNSLSMPPAEVDKLLATDAPRVIRFKVPENEEVTVHDLIRGTVTVHTSELDDKVLVKSDGMPTYHLASVVDDYLMKISHVIRGEEWLPSAPLHVLLYKYFGWEASMPRFAHLPLLLKPSGDGKLSKRDGDRLGFPVFPLDWTDPSSGETSRGFREGGYLPDAIINFLAFLGWNPGTEQEIFSMEELVAAFSIERIGKAGAKFDIHKAQWFNQQYLKAKSDEELSVFLLAALEREQIACSKEKAIRICAIMKERVTFPQDFWLNGKFFFVAPTQFDEQVIAKKWNDDAVRVIRGYKDEITKVDVLTSENAKQLLENSATAQGLAPGKVMQALRMTLTGGASGPDLMVTAEILGRDEVVRRLEYALKTFRVNVTS